MPHGRAERTGLPRGARVTIAGQQRPGDIGGDVAGRPLPARCDLGPHATGRCIRSSLVADRADVPIPGLGDGSASLAQLGPSPHGAHLVGVADSSPLDEDEYARVSPGSAARGTGRRARPAPRPARAPPPLTTPPNPSPPHYPPPPPP